MNIKEKVLKDGYVIGNNILKVDSFINHQVDTKLIDELGEYFSIECESANELASSILSVTINGNPNLFAISIAPSFGV